MKAHNLRVFVCKKVHILTILQRVLTHSSVRFERVKTVFSEINPLLHIQNQKRTSLMLLKRVFLLVLSTRVVSFFINNLVKRNKYSLSVYRAADNAHTKQ